MYSSKVRIHHCVRALESGACIAYPTESVWGLGCDPSNTHAISHILRLKKRPVEKGLILIGSRIEHFEPVLEGIAPDILNAMFESWPGHTTWLVPHKNRISPFVHGDSEKVAIRVSAHPVVRALTEGFGGPIISTSANPAGKPSAKSLLSVKRYFKSESLFYAPGSTGAERRASQIIDAQTGMVLRF